MRWLRQAVTVLAVAVTLAAPGCARVVDGLAEPANLPGVRVSGDGSGIVAGAPDAPVRLELFTEPQCTHCAHLQAEFGADIKSYLQTGQLEVTYRPLAFLDSRPGTGYSASVVNAMFLAVEPATTAGVFQEFVRQLWAHQDMAADDGTAADLAAIARSAKLPDDVADRIGSSSVAVAADAVSDANAELLYGLRGAVGTPTVYDLNAEDIVDHSDPDWLNNLMNRSA